MRKLLLCVALLLLPGAGARGQETAGAAGGAPAPLSAQLEALKGEAARLLESQSNRERAWGAYLAGRDGLEELAPALVRTVADPSLGDGPEESLVRRAALDALIRLDAKVPPETLRALPQGFADEALILLASAPEENAAALLDKFAEMAGEGGADLHWLAVGNLLAGVKARGFAGLLLKDLKVEADVAVLDRDGDVHFGGNGGGGCGCCGFYVSPEGFPPVGYYVLTGLAGRGLVVLAPGKHPVFYRRLERPPTGGSFLLPPERDVVRVEYLAELLDTTEDSLDFDARPSETVVCREAKQCRRELAGVRGRIQEAYAKLVGRLVEEGQLGGAGDAPAVPPMTFTLHDQRGRRTFPLPDRLKGVTVVVEGAAGDSTP
ncbi:MAG: hypothetical protein JOZ96_10495 [Acidobacteria bacterium]|nr:hypothetical protein [Acidobacteriota bacterium]